MNASRQSHTEYRTATLDDIPQILTLHARYQVDTISDDDRKDGFITTSFNEEQLTDIIQKEQGLFLAVKNETIVAYVMAASWQFWSQWPLFAHMIKSLPEKTYQGHALSIDNSYQYGPACVDKSVRGSGIFEGVFDFALKEMSRRYPVLITFINKINPRSFAAHTQKVGLDVVNEFEFNNNQYFELACLTQRGISKEP